MRGTQKESDYLNSEIGIIESKLTANQRRRFEEDVVIHCKRLYRYLYAKCKDNELSRDIMQETMIVAQRYYASGLEHESAIVWCWLQKISRNILISHYRKQLRRNTVLHARQAQICDSLGWYSPAEDSVADFGGDPVFHGAESREEIRKGKVLQNLEVFLSTEFNVLSLTLEEKTLLCGRHLQRKAFKELALCMGKPVSTVMSRYYALMKRLQRELCAWESEGLLDRKLSRREMQQLAKFWKPKRQKCKLK